MEDKEYALIPVGTEVSAKFKGAFCEAKIGKVNKSIKCKIVFEGEHGSSTVSDEHIKGSLIVGGKVEAKTTPSKPYRKATLTKIVDDTIYTVVFNDGDTRCLKKNQLCIKGDKHYAESESLDSMPLVHPEDFGSPVLNKARERKDDSWIGQIVCVDIEAKATGQIVSCPCLVVAADNQGRKAKKDHLIVRSFSDNKFITVLRKDTKPFKTELTESLSSQGSDEGDRKGNRPKNSDDKHTSKAIIKAYEKAVAYWESDVLPDNWNRSQLIDVEDYDSSSAKRGTTMKADTDDIESSSSISSFESSDEEGQPSENRDRFVAHLYRFMDERGTPLNKVPTLGNKDLDLYRLYSIVQHCGGVNRVNKRDKWVSISKRMNIPQTQQAKIQLTRAYKRYLQPFEECNRKLGSPMAVSYFGDGLTRLRRPPPQSRPSTTSTNATATPSNASGKSTTNSANTSGKSPPQQQHGNDKPNTTGTSSSLLSSRRSSAVGESDSGVSEKNVTTPVTSTKSGAGSASVVRRNRRESQSKEETDNGEKRNRKSNDVVKASRGRPRISKATVDSNDGDSSENEQHESSQSGDDASSSSNDYGTSLLPPVVAQAGFLPNSNCPLPVDSLVKVKCSKGSNTATYEGKINATRRRDDLDYEYFVHYRGWNPRYDEWIVAGRITQLIKIGEQDASGGTDQGNVASSRCSSVPNSVVSASESDMAASTDELASSAPATVIKATKQQEESPGKEEKLGSTTSGELASPESSDAGTTKSSGQTSSRKRKAEEIPPNIVKEAPPLDTNGNGSCNNVTLSVTSAKTESVNPDKQVKREIQSTRSTRSKPGEETSQTNTVNGTSKVTTGRRGGHRWQVSKNVPKDEPPVPDNSAEGSGNEKSKLSNNHHNAIFSLTQSKSPSKIAAEHRRSNRMNKFNFHFSEELDKFVSREEKIAFITNKITEIRGMYGDLKTKVADIDKKRRLYRAYVSSNKNSQGGSNNSITTTASITIKPQNQIDEISLPQPPPLPPDSAARS